MLVGGALAVLAFAAVPGMVEAGKHVHAGVQTKSVVVANGKAKVVTVTAAVPPKPYDPTQADRPRRHPRRHRRAAGAGREPGRRSPCVRLPQWADPTTAEAAGFRSIGDGVTGYEHYINWSYIDDDTILDPDHPESLVYQVHPNGTKTLAVGDVHAPAGHRTSTTCPTSAAS